MKKSNNACFILVYSEKSKMKAKAFDSVEDAAKHMNDDMRSKEAELFEQGYGTITSGGFDWARIDINTDETFCRWDIIKTEVILKDTPPLPVPQPPVEGQTVMERCPCCGIEVTMQWDTAARGYQAFCPYCGETLMLCDACRHSAPPYACDYNSEECFCRHSKPMGKRTPILGVQTPLGTIIVRKELHDGHGVWVDLRRTEADQDMSLAYIGFLSKAVNGKDCIEARIDGEGKTDQVSERVIFDGVEDYFRTESTEKKEPYIILCYPTQAVGMIANLGCGLTTQNGDRSSQYFPIAKGYYHLDKFVSVSLIENKSGLPESEWFYSLHLIDDVNDNPCELYHTKDLSEDSLMNLLKEILANLEQV